jgi:hypothetical protein
VVAPPPEAASRARTPRDPDGFTRWLFAGATQDSDPAAFVRGGPAHRGPVADTDAA